jgi:single-strand DNA-binding protein
MATTPPDTNLVVLVGTITAPPAVRRHSSGAVRVDLTIATRDPGPPRRVDAVPIVWWDPPSGVDSIVPGTRVTVVGAVRRRFWATDSGRLSRLEVDAGTVEFEVLAQS